MDRETRQIVLVWLGLWALSLLLVCGITWLLLGE